MSAILILKRFLNGINIFFTSTHPIVFIPALISLYKNRKRLFADSLLRLISIYLIIVISIRILKLLKHGFMPDRYFLLLIVIFSIFAAEGFLLIIHFIALKYFKGSNTVKLKKITFVILIILLVVMLGKSLRPHFDKPWYKELTQISEANSKSGKIPILITNHDDKRLPFYMNSITCLLDVSTLSISDKPFSAWNGQYQSLNNVIDYNSHIFYDKFKDCKSPIYMILFGFDTVGAESIFRAKGLKFQFDLISSLSIERKSYYVSIYKMHEQ